MINTESTTFSKDVLGARWISLTGSETAHASVHWSPARRPGHKLTFAGAQGGPPASRGRVVT
jgi:hypothetical protein